MISRQQPQRAVLYARVSTEEQASEEHFSIPAQINEMREYTEKKGWVVVDEFVDEGISGTLRSRPQLDAMLELVSEGGVEIVVAHELSRLSRSVYHTLEIFDVLGNYNVGFSSVKDPDFDFADPTKRLFLTILAAINQYYVDLLRLHTSKAKRQRARDGLYNASIAPFGYRQQGSPKDPPVIDPEEAIVVQMVFDKYATGRFSYQDIANTLNELGYRARASKKYPHGRSFSKDTIAEFLRNKFYAGKVVYRVKSNDQQEIFEGQHTALISLELWEICEKTRKERQSSTRSVQTTERVYLLSGLARCDICRRSLRCQNTVSGKYYREMSYQRGYADCPNERTGARADNVDAYVHTLMQSIRLPNGWLLAAQENLGNDQELLEIEKRRSSLEAERRRLKEMRVIGEFDEDLDLYNTRMAYLRREISSLPTIDQLETLREIAETVKDLPETWRAANEHDHRDLLRLMLDEVRVDVAGNRLVAIKPKTVFLPIFRQLENIQELDFGIFVPIWPVDKLTGLDVNQAMLKIPKLEPLVAWPASRTAMPFVADSPLLPDSRKRISGSLRQALCLARENGLQPKRVVQAVTNRRPPLLTDVRRWKGADATAIEMIKLGEEPSTSIDVLATRYGIWDGILDPAFQYEADLIQLVLTLLKGRGVWYLEDLLPLECAAHWVFQYFPELWPWAQENTWELQKLYMQLQACGFKSRLKRRVFYQPVRLGIALEAAKEKAGIFRFLSDGEHKIGLEKLRIDTSEYGMEYLISSQFTVLEVWASKIGS